MREKNIDYISYYEDNRFPSVEFMNMIEIFPQMIGITAFYLLINLVISEIFGNIISLCFPMFSYIAMLFYSKLFIKSVKNNFQSEFKLSEKVVSAVFLFALIVNSICLFMFCITCEEPSQSKLYSEMAINSLMLYIGFAVSLEKLFANEENSIISQILQPFTDISIVFGNYSRGFIIAIVCIVLVTNYHTALLLMLFTSILLMITIKCGNKRTKSYASIIINKYHSKRILFLQLGPANASCKVMKRELAEYIIEIKNYENLSDINYDVVIVLNTLKDNRQESIKEFFNMLALNENGIVLDPFICGMKKINFLVAWLGFPISTKKENSQENYVKLI